ncbi:hypothetical protein YC2023_082296 [Brassica napus]
MESSAKSADHESLPKTTFRDPISQKLFRNSAQAGSEINSSASFYTAIFLLICCFTDPQTYLFRQMKMFSLINPIFCYSDIQSVSHSASFSHHNLHRFLSPTVVEPEGRERKGNSRDYNCSRSCGK